MSVAWWSLATRFHLVEGGPWKDVLISFLEPESPYRPWSTPADLREGDVVIGIVDTEPRTVLTAAPIGADLDVTRALTEDPWDLTSLCDLAVLEWTAGESLVMTETPLGEASGERVLETLASYEADLDDRWGLTTATGARVLLASDGVCGGCDRPLPLGGETARERVRVSCYDAGDWPTALCDMCVTAMAEAGTRSVVEYRFSWHPECPSCSARQTKSVSFGLHRNPSAPPWKRQKGCLITSARWSCGQCWHEW